MIRLLVLLVLIAWHGWPQAAIYPASGRITSGAGVPVGGCSSNSLYYRTGVHTLYVCASGAWQPSGGGADSAILHYAGAGAPAIGCVASQAIYLDTASGQPYYCQDTDTWVAVSVAGHAHGALEAPARVGADLPGTCTLGDLYYRTGVDAGKNLYGCTATNTWTLLGGEFTADSGVVITGNAIGLDDTVVGFFSSSTADAAGDCSIGMLHYRTDSGDKWYCSAPNTWTKAAREIRPLRSLAALPGTCGVGEVVFKSDAPAGKNLYGCTALNTWTLLGGEFTADNGLVIIGNAIGVDDTVVGFFSSSTADAAGNCSVGTVHYRTDTGDKWYCSGTDTWTKAARTTGTLTAGKQVTVDASGSFVTSAYDVGATGGGTAKVLIGGNLAAAAVNAGSTVYFGPMAITTQSSSGNRSILIGAAFTATYFGLNTGTTQGSNGALTCTVQKNDSDTELEVVFTVGMTSRTLTDTGAVSYAQGDTLSIKCVNAHDAGSAQIRFWGVGGN